MSTVTNRDNGQAAMPTELAHRGGNGIEVLLLWDRSDGRLVVVVDDLQDGGSFEFVADDGRQALDAFYHPFAYAVGRASRVTSNPRPRARDRGFDTTGAV
jgi:hypothetical protein